MLTMLAAVTQATAQIVLDAAGRTVSVPPSINAVGGTIIEIPDAAQYQVRYRFHDSLPERPQILNADDANAIGDPKGFFTIPEMEKDDKGKTVFRPFVTYNVWRIVNLLKLSKGTAEFTAAEEAKNSAKADLDAAKQVPLLVELRALTSTASTAPTPDELERTTLTAKIQSLEKEETALVKLPVTTAVRPLRDLQAELRVLRESLRVVEARIAERERARNARLEELNSSADVQAAKKEVERLTKELEEKERALGDREYLVLKAGVLIRGEPRKQAVFGFPPFRANEALRLQLISDLPVLSENDSLYVLLINHQPSRHPAAFSLTVTSEQGTPILESQIRPVVPVNLEEGSERDDVAKVNVAPDMYQDIALSVGRRFKGNDIPKLSLIATADVVTEDKTTTTDGKVTTNKVVERKDVSLLTDYKLPQIHPLYRFNVTTGLTYSTIEDREFTKVQTAIDDPATMPLNEARYRIDTRRDSRKVRPVIGVTWYWRPIDPLLPLTNRDRLLPQPTIAFGVDEPAKNIFIGFSNELWRSVHISWGWHRGSITELKNRSDVNEDAQADLPGTRSVPENGAFVGVSFNINIIGKIFGIN